MFREEPIVSDADAQRIVRRLHTLDHTALKHETDYLGEFVPSFYQIVDEADTAFDVGAEIRIIRNRHADTLAWVGAMFYNRLMIEGCGKLRDGRIVTYDTRIDGEIRFKITEAPFGEGYGSVSLIPYRTVAVDPEVIELGSILYVPSAIGVQLSDGSQHDGVFIAEDIGSAIGGNRIDFFVGFDDHIRNRFSESGALTHGKAMRVYQIRGALGRALAASIRRTSSDLLP
jgi:3D (Asp-Asp-Asp) domain-containing protein